MARKRTAQELDAEIARLQKELEATRRAERSAVVDRMKEAIAFYEITAADLGLGPTMRRRGKPGGAPRKKTRPGAGKVKYRDDAGHTWSGYGRKPRWFVEAIASGKSEADLRA